MLQPAPGKRVTWRVDRRCFVLNDQTPLKGLTPTLAKTFYPAYREPRASRGPLAESKLAPDARRAVREVTGLAGLELGTTVDREVTQWVRLIWNHGLQWAHVLPTAERPSPPLPRTLLDNAAECARLRHLQHNSNLYTRRFLRELANRQLVPVASQLCVGSLDARLGTAVDVVCALSTGVQRLPEGRWLLRPGATVVLLELKCGWEQTYQRYCGRMKAPLAHLTDSPEHQHQLQLLLTRILFERTYRGRGHAVSSAAVVRVHSAGVTWYPQRAWTDQEQIAIWQALVARRLQPSTQAAHARERRRVQRLSAAAAAAGGVYAPQASARRTARRRTARRTRTS